MTCHPITHLLRPHLLRPHLRRTIHHIARHKAAHIAGAFATVVCLGTPVGLVALLPPTVAPPFVAPVPVRVPEPGTWVLLGTAVTGLILVRSL